jgi:hypothetical protein
VHSNEEGKLALIAVESAGYKKASVKGQRMRRLLVEKDITIHASPAQVWDVLVKPAFIKQ